jgi:hypothetical protein
MCYIEAEEVAYRFEECIQTCFIDIWAQILRNVEDTLTTFTYLASDKTHGTKHIARIVGLQCHLRGA